MEMERRIKEHPILGEIEKGKQVAFTYDGKTLYGCEGEPIAAALKAAGREDLIGNGPECLVRPMPGNAYHGKESAGGKGRPGWKKSAPKTKDRKKGNGKRKK